MNGPSRGSDELSPAVSVILAVLLPGVGQFYNGQFWKGVLIGLTSVLIVPWIWGIYDAYTVTEAINEGRIEVGRSGCLVALIYFVILIVAWLVVAFVTTFVLTTLGIVTITPELLEQLERLAQPPD